MAESCMFCAIIAGNEPATVVRRWPLALAIVPLAPVVGGHLLVIPTRHVRDVSEDPWVSAMTMRAAAELAVPPLQRHHIGGQGGHAEHLSPAPAHRAPCGVRRPSAAMDARGSARG